MITQNEIKYVKSLAQRKFRQKYNKFIAEGDKICSELLNAGTYRISKVYCTNEWQENHVTVVSLFKEKVTIVTEKELARISQLKSPNQVLLVLELPKIQGNVQDIKEETIIYLDEVQDPGNVGTIIRIADWFGISQVIRSAGTADFYSPKVVQSTMASFANVKLHTVGFRELKDSLSSHQSVGAVLGGRDLESFSWPQPAIIVMGNESKGVTPDTLDVLDHQIMIAGSKNRLADSLNVGIATALMCQSWSTDK